ncbi:hypothetical protein [Flavobacterium flavipallidum]|uniref:DUF3298 domain-containing protein n=1 Tax=Flavobacterium flavipallidum TaxID=3139140 RepID=A0ABU9HLD7_9FLAO
MKNKLLFLVFITVFFSSSFTKSGELSAHIDKYIFLKGKVAERTIIIKIKCYDESTVRYLNYYFEEDKKDHYLEGNLVGNAWQYTTIDQETTERNLVIREETDGSWKGYWREGSNKKINLILYPLTVNPDLKYYNYSQNKALDPYDANKIAIVELEKTKTEKIAKHLVFDWYTEKESGISLFRLQSENNKINLDSINTALEVLQLSYIHNYYHFNPNVQSSTIHTDVLCANESLISFRIVFNTIFKTQDPLKSQQFFTLDLHSGQQIDLESLLWFDGTNPKPKKNDVYGTYQYRKKIFAPKIFSILSQLYPQQMQSSDCNLNKEDTWAIPNFALTKKGILLSFSQSTLCNFLDWALIPYDQLKPYLQKKYTLN